MADPKTVKPVIYTHIGGQAVLEGIMMRGKYNWAIAVREPSGAIYTEQHDLVSASSKHAWLKWPIIRGMWSFYETMVLAVKAFGISAEHAGETEEEQLSSKEIGLTMVLGLGLAVGLFIVLPAVLTNVFVGTSTARPFTWNVVDGALRLAAFFAYIWAVSRVKDIHRVFEYHGAEHKTIHAYEHGLPLTPENIQQYETLHVRCGTAFLLMVMVIAIVVFTLFPGKAILAAWGVSAKGYVLLFNICTRILLLPLIAGLAYEVSVKWAGQHPDNPVVKVLMWPGMQLQRMTTAQPDDSMVEIAVAAMELVIAREDAQAVSTGVVEYVSGAAPARHATASPIEEDFAPHA
ncbi:MAG: DUF1385 domain-containing protein [Actinomycetia bacterium]|nr:DUF1385 domain-containing protein [Actinomycetes bacterium]